jgi:hypothetical protein
MKDDENEAGNFWDHDSSQWTVYSDIIDEKEWNRLQAIKSFSLQCSNCSSANANITLSVNTTVEQFSSYESFLRSQIARLNTEQCVRNLEHFDLRADSDGTVVIIVQVSLSIVLENYDLKNLSLIQYFLTTMSHHNAYEEVALSLTKLFYGCLNYSSFF